MASKNDSTTLPETAWLADGRECRPIALDDGGYIVRPVLEAETWNEYEVSLGTVFYGPPEFAKTIFGSPPTHRLSEEYARVKRLLSAAEDHLGKLNREVSTIKRQRDEATARLVEIEPLRQALEIIDKGPFTHVVKNSYGFLSIKEADEHVTDSDGETYVPKDQSQAVMTLNVCWRKGRGKRELQWAEGRGLGGEMTPCWSKDEAVQILSEHLAAAWAGRKDRWPNAISVAEEHGVAVPQEVRDHVADQKKDLAQKNVKKAREALDEAEKALRKLV